MSAVAKQKITTCLWCNFNAEEQVAFYLGVFKGSRILSTSRYGDAMSDLAGKVLLIEFEFEGQQFQALNAGPQFPYTEAISLSVDCDGQAEVDQLWSGLTADGGSPGRCGWLKDKFGVSWQIVPRGMSRLLSDPDPARAARAMKAMMTMDKLDLAAIERAADG